MSSQRMKVSKLIRRDGPYCHYCNVFLTRTQGTCDHVVPKSMGGRNWLGNYVLACESCNNERGTELDWCDCDFCGPLLDEFIHSDEYFDMMFKAMVYYNRPSIRRRGRVWKVYIHDSQHTFKTWLLALDFALTYGKEPRNGFRNSYR